MLFAYQCTTGARLRQFVLALLQQPSLLAPAGHQVALDDYLSSLWHAATAYRGQPFKFVFIAELLQKAFVTAPMPYDWTPALRQPYKPVSDYVAPYQSPEYYAESTTYAFFERRIKRQILELKHLRLQQPIPYSSRWENLTVEAFLERGTSNLEEETDEETEATWGYLAGILADGQYVE